MKSCFPCLILVYLALNIGPFPPSPAMSHYLIISDLKHKYSSHCYFCDLTDQLLKSRSSLKKHLGLLLRLFVMTFDSRSHPTPDCAFLFTMHCPLLPGQGMMRKYKKVMCFVLEEVVFMKTVISYSFSLSHSVSLFLSFFFLLQLPHFFSLNTGLASSSLLST